MFDYLFRRLSDIERRLGELEPEDVAFADIFRMSALFSELEQGMAATAGPVRRSQQTSIGDPPELFRLVSEIEWVLDAVEAQVAGPPALSAGEASL